MTPATETPFVDQLEALVPELIAFCRRLCRDSVLADDIAQSACLKAWSASESFKQGSPMRPWLFRIARNEFYQHCRKSNRVDLVESDVIESALTEADNQGEVSDAGKATAAIYALPVKQRDAFILVVAAGMTYDEAGEVLGCSAGTVKSRVSRARAAVMTDLDTGRSVIQGGYAGENSSAIDTLIAHADQLRRGSSVATAA